MGDSGIGKSTFLNLIAGVLRPTAGSIDVNRAYVTYLTQDDRLIPFRTVWQNILLAAELSGPVDEAQIAKANGLSGVFNLRGALGDLPSTLSGGMRRRVALIRQLVRSFDLALLDEPFGAQDRGMRESMEEVIYSSTKKEGAAAVIATHDADSAVALADRVMKLDGQGLSEAWSCPISLKSLTPSERRLHPEFVGNVSMLWRRLWERGRD